MAKRRRRGLGSSAAEHGSKIKGLCEVAAINGRSALDSLKKKDCERAIRDLSRAQFAAGRAYAHAQSGGGPTRPCSAQYATDAIVEHCKL